jgi:hypothetical protein
VSERLKRKSFSLLYEIFNYTNFIGILRSFNNCYFRKEDKENLNSTDENKEDALHRYAVSPTTNWEEKTAPPFNLTMFKV